MLKQRIITAVVLLAVLLATLLAPTPGPLVALLTAIAGGVTWEWLRLTLPDSLRLLAVPAAIILTVLLALLAIALLASPPAALALTIVQYLQQVVVPVVVVAWIGGATLVVLRANTAARRHMFGMSVFGIAAVVALWLALILLFLSYGAWFLVSLMALIWFADSLAYFAGKTWGRHKLAPRVSPGKTWEGALGGVAGAVLWMALSSLWPGSFAAVLTARWGMGAMLLIAAVLAGLSIVGDLFESLLKRRAGMKDSSQLLPGHGGIYDRIDALFPVAPLALLLTGSV